MHGGLWIGGESRDAVSGAVFDVLDPATGDVVATVADASPQDGEAALAAASAAQAAWASTAPERRAAVLAHAGALLRERARELAVLLSMEMGKPVPEAASEVSYAASYFDWYAGEAVRIDGGFGVATADPRRRAMVLRVPVGICVSITPWNFPIAMGARKLAAQLAAGCAGVIKPAAQTPLSMLALADALGDAGLAPGVVSVLPTTDAERLVAPLLRDPAVRKLSFTGSTAVGRRLMASASEQVLSISLELGGNAPFLVFEDADLDAAIEGAMLAKMRNGGQACTAANRFLVAEAVAEEFTTRLAARMAAVRVGAGTEPGVELGPLIDRHQRAKVSDLVDEAVARGARVVTGAHAPDGPGWFYAPTVLADVPDDARMLREEIFGPVAPICTFADEDEAVAKANATEYGLVAYAYTQDADRRLRMIDRLEAGMIGLNQGVVSSAAAPFGGVKQSGIGREGGREGIDAYLQSRYVATPAG